MKIDNSILENKHSVYKNSVMNNLMPLKPGKIVTDREKLKIPTINVDSLDEGELIAAKLISTLSHYNGIGISANQIGLNYSVCIVQVNSPIILINPVVLETYSYTNEKNEKIDTPFIEGCLSFPGKRAKVNRFIGIKIDALNLESPITFGYKTNEDYLAHQHTSTMLECIAVQHELDHLNGITMMDKNLNKPLTSNRKNRNELVTIVSTDGEMRDIKYKLLYKYLSNNWKLLDE